MPGVWRDDATRSTNLMTAAPHRAASSVACWARPRWALCLLSAAAGLVMAATAAAQDGGAQRTVSVTGQGQVAMAPDTARIAAGVTTQTATASAALKTNSAHMNEVLSGLAGLGIAANRIQTSGFSVTPQLEQRSPGSRSPPRIVGYRVANRVSVSVDDLARLGTVLDRLVALGATDLHGITFGVAERARALDPAREAAFGDARRKAALYAQAVGAVLGPVLTIREGEVAAPRPLAVMRAASGIVPVAKGEQILTVTISVTFALQ